MKQHITKKQWEELTIKQSAIWFDYETSNDTKRKDQFKEYPTIGQMIEFLGLGDDLYKIEIGISGNGLFMSNGKDFWEKELVDALWEAVKYKST